jgi:hypothetical protein
VNTTMANLSFRKVQVQMINICLVGNDVPYVFYVISIKNKNRDLPDEKVSSAFSLSLHFTKTDTHTPSHQRLLFQSRRTLLRNEGVSLIYIICTYINTTALSEVNTIHYTSFLHPPTLHYCLHSTIYLSGKERGKLG